MKNLDISKATILEQAQLLADYIVPRTLISRKAQK